MQGTPRWLGVRTVGPFYAPISQGMQQPWVGPDYAPITSIHVHHNGNVFADLTETDRLLILEFEPDQSVADLNLGEREQRRRGVLAQ